MVQGMAQSNGDQIQTDDTFTQDEQQRHFQQQRLQPRDVIILVVTIQIEEIMIVEEETVLTRTIHRDIPKSHDITHPFQRQLPHQSQRQGIIIKTNIIRNQILAIRATTLLQS